MSIKSSLYFAFILSNILFNIVSIGCCGDETATNVLNNPDVAGHLNGLSTSVKAGYSNFIPSATAVTTNLWGTNYAPVVKKFVEGFETNTLDIITNTTMMEMGLASRFLTELKNQGHLPGVPKSSHAVVTANLHTEDLKMTEFKTAEYPFSLTFSVLLMGDSLTNHYTVVRPSMGAAWELKKAWRTDLEGKIIKEWQVKFP